jgi:hypothetical protein
VVAPGAADPPPQPASSSVIPASAIPALGTRMVGSLFQVSDVSLSTVWVLSSTHIGPADEAGCDSSGVLPRDLIRSTRQFAPVG